MKPICYQWQQCPIDQHFDDKYLSVLRSAIEDLLHRICSDMLGYARCQETLPEAQRTQGVESITWVNISTRIVSNWFQWNFLNWLQIWPPDGATCIRYQFCHRMHHMHIDSKFDHQMAPFALVSYLTTKVVHQVESLTLPNCLGLPYCPIALLPYCPIALLPYCSIALLLYCPIALLPYCPIALVSLSARVTSIKYHKWSLTQWEKPDP